MFNHKTLDMTNVRERGKDLMASINKAVKDSQSTIIQDHYNELLVTKDQFDSLQKAHGTFESFVPDSFMFKTPYNVMEVRVK